MGTHARIIVRHSDDTASSVYLHYDGDRAGACLRAHYNTLELAEKLVSGGNLSSLGERIDPITVKHNFLVPEKGTCVYYTRDRGEQGQLPTKHRSVEVIRPELIEEYTYLFENGVWKVKEGLRGKFVEF